MRGLSMTSSGVQFDVDIRGVATLSLDNAERHNSLDDDIFRQMLEAFDYCEREALRVLCLRANGKHFCAGANLMAFAPIGSGLADSPSSPPLMQALHRLNTLRTPTVAMVHGGCIGSGAALASCCDIVVAEETAFFSIPEVRLGILPAAVIPYFAAAIGQRHLRRYLLSGERFSSTEAWHIGLVHQVCQAGRLAEVADAIVDALLRGGPSAVAGSKAAVLEAAPLPLSEEQQIALHDLVVAQASTPEVLEGVAAFVEKRSPTWHRTVK